MLVSHTHKFIFTRTVKTAGTSVEVFFESYCAPPGHVAKHGSACIETEYGIIGARSKDAKRDNKWFHHMSARLIREALGRDIWDAYFKFTTIRNPFDKVVSAFHYRQLPFERAEKMAFSQIRDAFRKWLLSDDAKLPHDRSKFLIKKDLCLDYFIRYENLEEGVGDVAKRLGIDIGDRQLPTLKGHTRPKQYAFQDYYDDETIAVISKAYDFELKHFSYTL